MNRNAGRSRHFLQRCDGTAGIEFALVAPILVMALIGAVMIGRYYWERDTTRDLIRKASRGVMVEELTDSGEIKTRFSAALEQMGVQADEITVTILASSAGDVARVNVPWTTVLHIPMMNPRTMEHPFLVDIPLPEELP